MAELELGGETVKIEDFSGRKAIRATKLLKEIAKGVPSLLKVQAEFVREYEAANVVELDRATARFEFPPRYAPLVEDGEPVHDDAGQVKLVKIPGKTDHLTDADWEAAGNKLKLPKSPSWGEQIAAVFPEALDLAETEVLKLLALVAMSNQDVARYAKEGGDVLNAKLEERGDEIIDAGFDELLELAVVAGEVCGDQYKRKVTALGDRVGNALRLFGINPESLSKKTTNSSEKPTSSTSSDERTDGPSETPSTTSDSDSSSDSETDSKTTLEEVTATV